MTAHVGAATGQTRPILRRPRLSPANIVGALAVGAALTGLFLVAQTAITTTPLVSLQTEARGDTLSLWVNNAEVLEHEHGNHSHDDDGDAAAGEAQTGVDALSSVAAQAEGDGFAMPASMMPGTPEEGFQRLQLELDFMNRQAGVATVAPQDFYLLADDGETWTALRGGTFRPTDLGSLQVLSTVLAFDIPVSVQTTDVELVWSGDGSAIHFAVDAEGGHSHG